MPGWPAPAFRSRDTATLGNLDPVRNLRCAALADAADAAAELVRLGKERWDAERVLRLAGEAVIGRLGDIATKLPDEVIKATPEIPWREVKGMRIIAAHAYHRIDYEEVWVTLRDDVPRLDQAIKRWRQTQA
jgi:uncharacterized protein with HEPN domain